MADREFCVSQPCPICGKQAETPRYRPFCSPRCADVDLGRWFNGAYAIPGPPPDLDDDPPEMDHPDRT
jgi:endogenous inhibitor of DNA gyrase (YacG/DUF329 family)